MKIFFQTIALFALYCFEPVSSSAVVIDDFESPASLTNWSFNNGPEFPGAVGSLSLGTGHVGSGAHLVFDISGGGNYVSADRDLAAPLQSVGIALWVRHPGGVNIQIRVTDSTGQTLQYSPTRPFEASDASCWYRLIVSLGPTAEYWGGANDGIVHNPITKVSVLAQPGKTQVGAIDFDDVEALTSLCRLIDPSENSSAANNSDLVGNLGVQLGPKDINATGMDLAQSLGFKWARIEMFWTDIETEPGVYDFTKYDDLLSDLTSRGMKAHFVLCYGNAFYTGLDWFSPPRTSSAIDAFAEFARNTVIHFQGNDVQTEIWNEPNIARFWDPPNPEEYAALTEAVIPQIHAGDPEAKVSTGGLAGMDFAFLNALFHDQAANGVDAIGVHPYRLEIPEKLSDEMVLMRTILEANFATTPAVWSTESGYSSAWYGDGTLETNRIKQAKLCARQLLTGVAVGLAFDNLFQLRDHGSDPWDAEMNFGIVDFNRAEKPLTSSIRTLLQQCRGRTFSGTVRSPHSAIHVLKFQGARDLMLVIWSETIGATTEKILLPGVPISALDYLGKEVAVTEESDSTYSVQIGDSPVYLIFSQPRPPIGLRVAKD